MECKLHNRDIYTERQSCHARTPRVLTTLLHSTRQPSKKDHEYLNDWLLYKVVNG